MEFLETLLDESKVNAFVQNILESCQNQTFSEDESSDENFSNDDDNDKHNFSPYDDSQKKNPSSEVHYNYDELLGKLVLNENNSDAVRIEKNLKGRKESIQMDCCNAQRFDIDTPQFLAYTDASRLCFSEEVTVTPEVIEQLESNLDFYEQVSLVFLLYDSPYLALQRLKTAYTANCCGSLTSGLLSDWVRQDNWINNIQKFLEALCIIQNYQALEIIGYSCEEADSRFLPRNPHTSLFVDLLRKGIYQICENLNESQLNRLLKLISSDMSHQNLEPPQFPPELMEMNILYMICQHYITINVSSGQSISVKNLTKHLKVLEEYSLEELLQNLVSNCNKTSLGASAESRRMLQVPTIQPSHSVISVSDEQPVSDVKTHYPVNKDNMGYAVIINQKNFYRESDPYLQDLLPAEALEDREGTDVDRDRLTEAFLSFGFKVKIWSNLTHVQLKEAVNCAATKLAKKSHSCFVLCILSHGKINAVYGANSIPVDVDEIERMIQGKYCPNLMRKPKMLIIQACQGFTKQEALPCDITEDGPKVSCAEVADMLTFWSTVPGYAAFRDKLTGSWFIKTLWTELVGGPPGRDLLSTFVCVNGQVSERRAQLDGELKAMTPQFRTSFGRSLVFPYHSTAKFVAYKRIIIRYLFENLLHKYLGKKYDQYVKKKATSDGKACF